jgi:RHS repeat-associated protein
MLVGDPINPSNGNSYLQEDDYLGAGKLVFRRFYNSNAPVGTTSIGSHWRHNFSQSLVVTGSPATSIVVYRPDGKQEAFTKLNGAWSADPDVTDILSEVSDSQGSVTAYKLFVAALHHYEIFGTTGLLQSVSDESGLILSFSYSTTSTPTTIAPSAGLLITVTDAKGRQLGLTYAANHSVQQVTLPGGGTLNYTYDSGGNLTSVQYPDGKTRQYVYNESSLTSGKNFFSALTGIIDEFGTRFETTAYDAAGRAISSSLSGGVQSTQVTYNTNGTSSVQFPLGATTLMSFSAPQGVNKVGTVNQYCGLLCGQSWHLRTYDANGNPSGYTDFGGNVTATTYTSLGLLSQQIDAQGQASQRTTNFTWDNTLRAPLSRVVLDSTNTAVESGSWKYNGTGQTLASCQSDPHVSGAGSYACGSTTSAPSGVQQTSFTYCTSVDGTQCPLVGLLLTVDGPRTDVSDITHYSYYLTTDESGCGTVGGVCHRAGDLYQVTDALGHITTMVAYDKNGRVVRSQDSNNVITDLTYTPRGWLKTRTVGGATTTIDYDAVGNVIKITDADGVFVGYTYDAAHRLTDITDAVGNHIHYTLDAAGNKTKEDTYDSGNTLRRTLSRSYNTLGQLTGITDGLNHTVFNASYTDSYDANGNLVHTADGLGIQHKQGYDALNRLVSTLDNYNGTDTATQNTQATFAYDALDNLEGVTDPDGLSTTYDYDGLSNPKALHSPDTGTTSFQVDAAGNRIQQTDAKGIVRTTTYDAINRPVTVSYPDSTQNITYHYDEADSVTGCSGSFPTDRLTRIVETAVTTTYCYDSHGNVTKKTQAQGTQVDTTSYSYTAADRLSSITTPSQTITQYSRDSAGRVSGVTVTPNGGAGQTVVSAISYLPFGPIGSYTLGNGQTITRSYDANYQLTDLTSPALNLHFARDVMGNITALGNTPGANPAIETYGYDSLYHLAGVNDASGSLIEAYTYSKTGDRLSKVKAGGVATGMYGYQSGTHWLTSIGSAARTYDGDGNTIGSANAGETLGYGYSDRNRLAIVQRDQQTAATYVYNAKGERVAKSVTSPQVVNERFAYNEVSQLIGEYSTANRDYIWLSGLPIAVVDDGTTSVISYVHADGVGAPRAIADSTGNIIWRWAYQGNSFGEQQPAGSYVYNLRFPGQYYDAESSLTYNQSRYYDTSIGRYVESDSLGLGGGLSTYSYVLGNPLAFIDLDGRQVAPGDGGDIPQNADYWDMQAHNPERIFGMMFGVNVDHVNPPHDDSIQSVVSPVEWAVGGGLVRGGGAAVRAIGICRGAAASGLGDLTIGEVRVIQSVVDRARRPLNVVGSAARGTRRGIGTNLPIGKGIGTRSDIDYLAPPYGLPYFEGLQESLPSIDPAGGISPGLVNPYMGPSIRFEPGTSPFYVPGG